MQHLPAGGARVSAALLRPTRKVLRIFLPVPRYFGLGLTEPAMGCLASSSAR